MTQEEFRNIIKECVQEILKERFELDNLTDDIPNRSLLVSMEYLVWKSAPL